MRKITVASGIFMIALSLSGCGQRANPDNRPLSTIRNNQTNSSAVQTPNENKNFTANSELNSLTNEVKNLQQDLQNQATGAQDLNIDTTLPTE